MIPERETYQAWAVFCWHCQDRFEPTHGTDANGSDALFWFTKDEIQADGGPPGCCPRCGTTEISARWVVAVTYP